MLKESAEKFHFADTSFTKHY